MHLKIKIISLLLCSLSTVMFVGCNNREDRNDFIGKKVKFNPNKMLHLESNFSPTNVDSLKNLEYKFIIYYNSGKCTSCAISHLAIWRHFMYYHSDPIVDYIFLFQKKNDDIDGLTNFCKNSRWSYNMYIDTLGVFEKENPILTQNAISMFMINKNKEIIYIGNPINSYESQIELENILDSLKHN